MPIKNKGKASSLGLIFMLTLALSACSDEERLKDLHHFMAGLKKAVTIHKRKNILDDIHFPTPLAFQSSEKQRDPFEDEQASYGGGELTSPLTAYPLKAFEFIGMLIRDEQSWAIIKAPDNKVYQVTIKDRIGNHYGRIVEISSSDLKVEEEVPAEEAGAGGQGKVKRIVTLQLKGGN